MGSLKPRICVASHHTSLAALVRDAEFLQLSADPDCLLELRLDHYTDIEPAAVLAAIERLGAAQCLVTCRRAEEGGGGCVPEAQRLDYLQRAVAAGVAYVDVELATLQAGTQALARLKCGPSRLVISAHDFVGVPSLAALRRSRLAAEALGADVVKLAVTPTSLYDAWPLLQLLGETAPWQRPFLGLAMGEVGLWSRILAARFAWPAPFTFARAEQAAGTAPGQPSWRALQTLYRFAAQTADMPLYGVMGSPVIQSKSPHVHNAALQAAGLPGVYLPWRVDGDPLPFLRDWAPALGLVGLSVTLPHKEAVLAACRSLSPLAQRIGAVNTLTQPQDGTWVGDNTDAAAALQCLEGGLATPLRNRRVLVLGAGGVAKAVAHAARQAGAEVLIANRSPERAAALAQAVGGQVVQLDALPPGIEAVVNGTPVGMHPHVDSAPLQSAAQIPAGALVFETIYAPPQTQLLRWATARGCPTVGGVQMFLAQAAAQFVLFTGQAADRQVMGGAFDGG